MPRRLRPPSRHALLSVLGGLLVAAAIVRKPPSRTAERTTSLVWGGELRKAVISASCSAMVAEIAPQKASSSPGVCRAS